MNKFNVVCVIDDDPAFTFLAKEVMEAVNFYTDLLVYDNGQKAVLGLTEIIESGKTIPDLVLLDLRMPVMDGWDFLDDYSDALIEKNIPVFIISSSINPADYKKANQYKCVSDYIVKPITEENLLEIAKRIS